MLREIFQMKQLLAIILGVSLCVGACGLTKKDLGLSRNTPDETKVETRRSLDLPPDFDQLPD